MSTVTFNGSGELTAQTVFSDIGTATIVIIEGYSSIAETAFDGYPSITSVTIPNSVTIIGDGAFRECTGLTSVTIPNSVTIIGYEAFYSCTSLTSVTIGNSVTNIGGYAFYSCTSLTSVTIPNSVTIIGDGAFYECTSLTSVTIGNSVTNIGGYAFNNCTSITSVTIGNSVTNIGDYTFSACTSLTSVTIPNSVTTIGGGAFNACTSLTSVVIEDPSKITSVQTDSFTNVSNNPNSSTITFYDTADAASLTGNWSIISTYYASETFYSFPACFNEGTKILSLNNQFEEEYIPIENLKKGDVVKSYKHGYRKIDLIGKSKLLNNPNNFSSCMYKMEKTDTNGLIEDLIVTGGHSILVDDLGDCKDENEKIFNGTQMIDGKYLLHSCVSKDFIKMDNNNIYTYYHFILENNGDDNERFGVYANGILTETPPKKTFLTFGLTLTELVN